MSNGEAGYNKPKIGDCMCLEAKADQSRTRCPFIIILLVDTMNDQLDILESKIDLILAVVNKLLVANNEADEQSGTKRKWMVSDDEDESESEGGSDASDSEGLNLNSEFY